MTVGMIRTSTEDVLGYHVYAADTCSLIDQIMGRVLGDGPLSWLACLNPHSFARSLQAPKFELALKSATWLIPDGVGVVLASKINGGRIHSRVTGADVFFGLMERLNTCSTQSVFFLGGSEQVLGQIAERVKLDYPNVRLAGTLSPPFKESYTDSEIAKMVATVNQSRADVLWVGLTAPKQESLILDISESVNVRFAAAIGAVFDFYVGRVKRSHPVFQRVGLEWLPRLIQEPRRLWRRTVVSAPVFLWHVLKQRLKQQR